MYNPKNRQFDPSGIYAQGAGTGSLEPNVARLKTPSMHFGGEISPPKMDQNLNFYLNNDINQPAYNQAMNIQNQDH